MADGEYPRVLYREKDIRVVTTAESHEAALAEGFQHDPPMHVWYPHVRVVMSTMPQEADPASPDDPAPAEPVKARKGKK